MASTPPRRTTRLHTPPSPLHGAKFDRWEPYSPRRSSRVAAAQLQSKQTDQPRRAQTPTRTSTLHIPKSTRPTSCASLPTHQHQYRSSSPPASPQLGMLPTPSKTPRKKAGRILFPPRPATIEEAMPTPRKIRHETKSEQAFSISAMAEEEEILQDPQDAGIPIYTDSKERVPSLGGDDNPFLTRTASTNRSNQEPKRRRTKQKTDQEMRMDEAARNEEGLIYVFRGKKIFRRYDDRKAPVLDEDEEAEESNMNRRATGSSTGTRFTRTSYKPRLLFPTKEQLEEREHAEEEIDDEEALTDIELPSQPPKLSKAAPSQLALGRATTPVKESPPTATPSTPPPTTRTTRSKAVKDDAGIKIPGNPFSQWVRRKPSSQELVGKGLKRGGDELDRDGEAEASKRRIISK